MKVVDLPHDSSDWDMSSHPRSILEMHAGLVRQMKNLATFRYDVFSDALVDFRSAINAVDDGSISRVDGISTGLTNVTFSNVQAHATAICGPLYDHLFVRKMDLIDNLEIFLQNRQFLSRESAKSILRQSRHSKRTHWTKFDECFEFGHHWRSVCGPIRLYLDQGGDLADVDAVKETLDGADVQQQERLIQRARDLGVRFKEDFQDSKGLFSRLLFTF